MRSNLILPMAHDSYFTFASPKTTTTTSLAQHKTKPTHINTPKRKQHTVAVVALSLIVRAPLIACSIWAHLLLALPLLAAVAQLARSLLWKVVCVSLCAFSVHLDKRNEQQGRWVLAQCAAHVPNVFHSVRLAFLEWHNGHTSEHLVRAQIYVDHEHNGPTSGARFFIAHQSLNCMLAQCKPAICVTRFSV